MGYPGFQLTKNILVLLTGKFWIEKKMVLIASLKWGNKCHMQKIEIMNICSFQISIIETSHAGFCHTNGQCS
jgi:hypothetical protein